MAQIEVTVGAIRDLTPGIRELVLRSADGNRLPAYAPGAHIDVAVGADGEELRAYALIGGTAEADDPEDTYRIAVQREAAGRGGSRFLCEVAVGTRLRISPPKNDFPLSLHPSGRLLIAEGIGIAPIYAMVRALVQHGLPFELHYLGRAPEEMAYRTEIAALAGAQAHFHIGRAAPAGDFEIEPPIAALSYPSELYVCGVRGLNDAVVAMAEEYGLSDLQIHALYFTPAPVKINTNSGFDVELRQSGKTVHVPPELSILESLIDAGYQAKFYCGKGECGFCPLPILEADGVIEHRDEFLSDEEKASNETLCICVSRLKTGGKIVLDA